MGWFVVLAAGLLPGKADMETKSQIGRTLKAGNRSDGRGPYRWC
jgi:hypothetical protein